MTNSPLNIEKNDKLFTIRGSRTIEPDEIKDIKLIKEEEEAKPEN